MVVTLSRRGKLGALLIVVSSLALLPAVVPQSSTVEAILLAPAIAAMAAGTWLVGTDVNGQWV